MSKKGEKSLQMIFGLFILLIISLVILSLFFKFTERSSSTMTQTSEDFFTKQQIGNAESECATLCSEISDVDDALEFCRKYQEIDFDGDKRASALTRYDKGRWAFCEDRIPCFILSECVRGPTQYDGAKCKKLMQEFRPDYYKGLDYEDLTATCDLPAEGDDDASANWVLAFGYYTGAP